MNYKIDIGWNFSSITVILKFLFLSWRLRDLIHVDVCFLKIVCNSFSNVNEPVSGHPWGSSFRFPENIFFCVFHDSNVIEFSPYFLESIINECVVMTTVSITIMHANRMKIVWFLLHIFNSIWFINLLLKVFHFILHLLKLILQLSLIPFKEINAWVNFWFVSCFYLILEWNVIFNSI